MARSVYLKLEQQIAADERGGILHRWRYGRALLDVRKGRQRLPKGFIADRIKEAEATDIKGISEREIQYRIACAEAYPTEVHSRTAVRLHGTWTALRDAGFPAVDVDESDLQPDDLETIGEPDPYTEEPLFDIPGFKPVLKIRGRKVDLADATVREAVDYRDMCHEMHANFGRTVDQVDASVEIMLAGSEGDLDASAVEAYQRGTDGDDDAGETPPAPPK